MQGAPLYQFDTGPVDSRNAKSVRDNVLGFRRTMDANVQRTTVITDLPEVLETFDQKLFFTRIPLLVLVLQIAGIVLYYLFMVSTMLVERQQSEISLFKSRGATTAQVMQIYVIEGAGDPSSSRWRSGRRWPRWAWASGPRRRRFADLSGGANLNISRRLRICGPPVARCFPTSCCYCPPTAPPVPRSCSNAPHRRGRRSRLRSRATTCDLVLVWLSVASCFSTNSTATGRHDTDRLLGDQAIDPVKLLTPAFFILTVGLVFLRLFPNRAAGRGVGGGAHAGDRRADGNVAARARPDALLAPGAAADAGDSPWAVSPRLRRHAGPQLRRPRSLPVRLAASGEAKFGRRTPANGPTDMLDSMRTTAGGGRATPRRYCVSAEARAPVSTATSFALLGVDTKSFDGVGYFRDDFADDSLRSLMGKVAPSEEPKAGPTIPAGAKWLGVWVNPIDLKGRVGIDAYVRREQLGRYLTFALGPDGGVELPPGWSFLVGDLTRVPGRELANMQFGNAPPQGQFEVVSLSVGFVTRVSAVQGTVQLDALQSLDTAALPGTLAIDRVLSPPGAAVAGYANWQMVADFESPDSGSAMQGLLPVKLNDAVRLVPSTSPTNAIELAWRPVQGNAPTHGLRPGSRPATRRCQCWPARAS